MQILGIILFEFILGYVLQAFSLVLGLYAFSKQKIEMKKFVITSLIMTVVIYITRLLPVSYGVHTLLDIAIAFLLGVFLLKLPVLSTGIAVVAVTLLIMISETVYSFAIINVLGQAEFDKLISNSLSRCIVVLPTSIIFTGTISVFYYFFVIKKQKRYTRRSYEKE